MNRKNNLWTELFEQLVVVVAIITLFCLLPDFSDGNHLGSQINLLEASRNAHIENIAIKKTKNKRKKKRSGRDAIVTNENNDHNFHNEEMELTHSLGDILDEQAEEDIESTNSLMNQDQDKSEILAAEKLNRVEKINAEIEEQSFVLTVQQEQDKLTDEVLNKIESNLLSIKKMAQQEGIDSLIDNPSINEIDKKIALYRKNS